MRRHRSLGISTIEFALSMLVLVPLLLGTGAIGINMIHAMQTIQVSRDAGHMYARGVDFAQTGNKVLLSKLGTNLGLASTNSGSAVVILSALTYVDKATCTAVGAVDEDGNPSGCTNYGKWVFTQRLVIGRSSLRSSNFGTPTGVTIDSLGRISMNDYVRRAGAVAQFSSANGINPYAVVDNQVSGLPSRQVLYLTEAAAQGFRMPPFVSGAPTYSFAFF